MRFHYLSNKYTKNSANWFFWTRFWFFSTKYLHQLYYPWKKYPNIKALKCFSFSKKVITLWL